MNDREVLSRLRAFISREFGCERGAKSQAAEYFGVSRSMITLVLKGDKFPTKSMLDAIGVEKQVVYRWKK